MASRSFDNEKPTLEATEDDPSKKKRKRKRKISLEEQEQICDEQIKHYKQIMREIEIAYIQSYRLLEDCINNNVPN
ncbi:unnamed protein product [Macrosiphum euphorbiae]|uniref:Uncharacterized protein n=1 Tax=Macrosiphum euphorbiae TaxID=13131 RepID=A0AAV0VQ27_9HEMI|nr:unnamed protein product [Macrosiphum euphorbiae]